MSETTSVSGKNQVQIIDPPIARFIFGDVRLSWLWLILRLYAGYEWFSAGLAKMSNPVWFGDKAGVALTGFITGALAKTAGDHPDVQAWYGAFLQNNVLPNAALWSKFVVIGEMLVGVALILGIFTGLAAFFGGFMNVNYLMAGTVSTNPMLFVIATWLVLAWKTAGWLGLDRWVLPRLGKLWSPVKVISS
ncbi:MAG TPA: DoxX family protein [Leptolinea sp.]